LHTARLANTIIARMRRMRGLGSPVNQSLRPLALMTPTYPDPQTTGEKKPARGPVLKSEKADYFLAASAAASAAVEAAEAASEAAAEAVAAAAAASAAGVVAAAPAAGAAASVVVVVVVVAAGASTAAGVVVVAASSFFEQAARATAIRETISRDFFMVFP
jgi:hypothetical protein